MITFIIFIIFLVLSLAIIIWHFHKRKTDKKYYENSIIEDNISHLPNKTRVALIALIILTIIVYVFILRNGSIQ